MRVSILAVVIFSCANSAAWAYLGGFEKIDGYIDVGDFGGTGRNFNVPFYNAGQYDENIPANYQTLANGAGLWKLIQ
jgi:hypothetical protein